MPRLLVPRIALWRVRARDRALFLGLVLFALAFGLFGCANDELFGDCPFDDTIIENCNAGDSGAQFTCVVETHPQCAEDVCLSWKNSQPFCTRRCTSGGGECPSGSLCAEYNAAQGKYFCVPESLIR